ncbi:MAG: hypothetical protein HYU56_01535 [Candidatus Aenigmarchaeota archaeon]|nr:hypothetical protein [Candidatus Aenigmarchaeota archaeon]
MGLVHIFGEKPVPKVLDFFRVHSYWDYSLKDLSKATKISHRTLQQIIPQLVKHGFLKYTRTEGKAKMFIFNKESKIAKELHEFARTIDFEFLSTDHKKKQHSPEIAFDLGRSEASQRFQKA